MASKKIKPLKRRQSVNIKKYRGRRQLNLGIFRLPLFSSILSLPLYFILPATAYLFMKCVREALSGTTHIQGLSYGRRRRSVRMRLVM